MSLTPQQRTGLLAAAIVGGVFLGIAGLVAVLAVANRDKATERESKGQLADGEKKSESNPAVEPKSDDYGQMKRNNMGTVVGVVDVSSIHTGSWLEWLEKEDRAPPPKERMLLLKCRAKGRPYDAICLFDEQPDRKDVTLGAKAGDVVTVRGKVLYVENGEVILGSCELLGRPRR